MSQETLNAIFEKYGPLMGQANIWAELAVPVEMTVWNGKHPVDENKSHHIAGKGSRVLIWMHSRFGDYGITDNLIDPCGYDARVDLSVLKNIVDAGPRPYVEPRTDKKKMYFITVKQAWSNVVVMNSVAVQTKDLNEALTEARELAASCIKQTTQDMEKEYEFSKYDFVITGDEIVITYNMKERETSDEV